MYKVSKFKEFWAVWLDDELVCVCVYKRGAEALRAHLAEKDRQVTFLRQTLIDQLGMSFLYASCGQ